MCIINAHSVIHVLLLLLYSEKMKDLIKWGIFIVRTKWNLN